MVFKILGLITISSLAFAEPLPKSINEAQDSAVKLTQELIKIDTVNPPGNEIVAAKFLKSIFDKAHIDNQIYESAPGRGNLVARLKGDGTKKPILLVNHLDVVGIERAHWSVDPFGGQIIKGRLYGRGSSDMKDIGAIELTAMLLLQNSGKLLHRDIIFSAVADEESGGQYGMKYLVENHWPEISAEFAFNEGSRGKPYLENGKVRWASLQVTERRSINLRVVAHGTSAHSMLQMPDNAISNLSKAIAKISDYKPPIKLNPAVKKYIEGMAKLKHLPKNWYLKASAGNTDDARGLYSMLHTTLNPTIIKGGFRSNVIPADAEAIVNCRLLPGANVNDLIKDLLKVVHDPKITIDVDEDDLGSQDVPISDMGSEAVKAYEKVIQSNFGKEVPFIPTVGAGATDSRYLRAKGVNAYALEPYDDQPQNAHGNDESISVEGLKNAVKIYYELLLALAT